MPLAKIKKKLARKERRFERAQLMKQKPGVERFKVIEEVFDQATVATVYGLVRRGLIKELRGVLDAGKESRIYWALGPKGEDLILKIYLTTSATFRKGMLPYILGDARFEHVRRTTRGLVYAWATKEFKNLVRAYEAGVRVPKPIAVEKNVLLMEFIGERGVPAPLMKDVKLVNPQRTYEKLLQEMRKLYREAGLVHGDLGPFNVMIWRGEPVIFDVSQAVLLSHPLADELLRRDIRNLNTYFRKLGVEVKPEEEIYDWIRGD